MTKDKWGLEVIEALVKKKKVMQHGECHEICPSQSSGASVRRIAGALKLKPLQEHNSWRGPQEVACLFPKAGYRPLLNGGYSIWVN